MKRTLTAIAAATALLAGTASAQLVADQETLTYNLNGFVQSECNLTPNGTVAKNVVMTAVNAQGVGQINFSCNSPYQVSIESANGGMQHVQSPLLIPYQLRHAGKLNSEASVNYGPYVDSSTLVGSPLVVEESLDWLSIASNAGYRQINIDVLFNDDTYAVAGNYSDSLTVTLTAVF